MSRWVTIRRVASSHGVRPARRRPTHRPRRRARARARDALSVDRVHTGALDRTLYARDASVIDGRAHAASSASPSPTAEVQACVRTRGASRPRRSSRAAPGTGLAGGAVPCDEPVVIVTTRMDAHPRGRRAERRRVGRARRAQPRPHAGPRALRLALRARSVEPAVVHDRRQRRQQLRRPALPRRTASPARTCSPLEVVLPDGDARPCSAASTPNPPASTSAARFVGSEGTMGIATRDRRAAHSRTRRRCARCCSTSRPWPTPAATVSGIIAAGVVPAALEMMDAAITRPSRTSSARATRPTPRRCCSSRSTGCPAASSVESEIVDRGRPRATAPAPCASPPTSTSGRCCGRDASRRSARSPGSKPNYYLHDTVIPRTQARRGARPGLRDRGASTTCS